MGVRKWYGVIGALIVVAVSLGSFFLWLADIKCISEWGSAIISALLSVLFYCIAGRATRSIGEDPDGTAHVVTAALFLAFLFAAAPVGLSAYHWISESIDKKATDATDSTSVLTAAQTFLLAACALWIPLATSMWNEAKSRIAEELDKHKEIASRPSLTKCQRDALLQQIDSLTQFRRAVLGYGDTMRQPFWITIVATVGLSMLIGMGFFIVGDEASRMFSRALAGLSAVLFLWDMTLVLAFVLILQAGISRYDHRGFLP